MPEPKPKLELKQNVASGHADVHPTTAELADAAAAADATYKKLNRFSELEKRLLFATFKDHQQIIDIKQRRNSYSSHKQAEVRACWERIVSDFNAHPDTKNRTMRQIQKFWLNSKLRNQIPSVKSSSTPKSTVVNHRKSQTSTHIIKRIIGNDGTIVPISSNAYSTVTLDLDHIDQPTGHIVKSDQHIDDDSQDMPNEPEILDDEEDEDVSNLIELKFMDESADQPQQHNHDQSQQQHPENFHQNSMQIGHHPEGAVQFSGMDNMEVINDGPEQQQQHQHHNQQQHHHYTTTHNSSTNTKLERRLFCGSEECVDGDNGMSSVNAIDDQDNRSTDMDPLHAGNEIEVMSYSEQMNEIRLQEATCRLKESQLRCELQQLAVTRAHEEMRQKREIHVLQITEMQLKLDKMKKDLRMSLN